MMVLSFRTCAALSARRPVHDDHRARGRVVLRAVILRLRHGAAWLLACCLWCATVASAADGSAAPATVQTADPNATAAAKAVLTFIASLPGRSGARVLSGQSIGHTNVGALEGFQKYFVELEKRDGHSAAILNVDYGSEEFSAYKITEINKTIIGHWRAGGLVTISIHPRNPWTGGGVRELARGGVDYLDVVKPGSASNRRWMKNMQVIADGLTELRDAGVVVLWRPLHEMNGDFYWWSMGSHDGRASAEEYAAFWRDLFQYLTVTRGLKNLLWVYSANAQVNEKVLPTDYYYPGNDVVDIVGLDIYANTLDLVNAGNGYDRLVALGKPFAITEVGPAFWVKDHPRGNWDTRLVIDAIRTRFPATTYFVFWSGWTSFFFEARMGIVDNQNGDKLLTDPWVFSRQTLAPIAPGH